MINRYIEIKNFCKKNIIIVDNIDTGDGEAFNEFLDCRNLVEHKYFRGYIIK
jgi:hypothetical protein